MDIFIYTQWGTHVCAFICMYVAEESEQLDQHVKVHIDILLFVKFCQVFTGNSCQTQLRQRIKPEGRQRKPTIEKKQNKQKHHKQHKTTEREGCQNTKLEKHVALQKHQKTSKLERARSNSRISKIRDTENQRETSAQDIRARHRPGKVKGRDVDLLTQTGTIMRHRTKPLGRLSVNSKSDISK